MPMGPRPLGHLARVRVLRGHTQASLAEASGVSRRTIIALEKDAARGPRFDTAWRLARALGQPLGVVFPELPDEEIDP